MDNKSQNSIWGIFKTTIIGLAIIALVWWFLGEFFLFPTSVNAYFIQEPNSNNYEVISSIINLGSSNMKDVNFHFEYVNCDNLFFNPELKRTNSISNCKISNNYWSINVHCDKLNEDDSFDVEWKTDKDPNNCMLGVKYDPIPVLTSFIQLSQKTNFNDYRKFFQTTVAEPVEVTSFVGLKIENMSPIRQWFYSGGKAIIKYNIVGGDDYNFTITTEWFDSNGNYIDDWTNSSSIKKNTRWPWFGWSSNAITSDKEEYTFRAIIRYDDKYNESFVNYSIIKNDDLLQYLQEDEYIKLDNDVIKGALNFIDFDIMNNDEDQAKALLDVIRKYMIVPPETEKNNNFNDKRVDSITAFKEKEGTSSEFSDVYTMLLRSLGIPAKVVETNNNYYCVEVYIKDKGWIKTDPFDKTMVLGEWSIQCRNPDVILN